MKKFMLSLLLTVSFLTVPVSAQTLSTFFKEKSGQWGIVGLVGDKNVNSSCVLTTKWKNGAFISLVNDLNDGELFLIYHNPSFKFVDSNLNVGFFNFKGKDIPPSGLKIQMTFEVINENTIRIRKLSKELILPLYSEASLMLLELPGSLPSISVGLEGSRQSLFHLNMCINKWRETHPIEKKGELL